MSKLVEIADCRMCPHCYQEGFTDFTETKTWFEYWCGISNEKIDDFPIPLWCELEDAPNE